MVIMVSPLNKRDSQTEPKKKSRRFYLSLIAAVLLLAVIVGVVIFELSNIGQTNQGPGPIDIEVVADKPFYLRGEQVSFTIYVNNPQNWSVPEPLGVSYEMNRNGDFVFGVSKNINFGDKQPSFPPHSRTLYETRVWDGKVGPSDNRTLAPTGSYTYTVAFDGPVDYGNSGNCTLEVRLNPAS